jgi:hypothetical protein
MIKHEYSQRVIALILTAFLRRRQKCGYRRYNLCPIIFSMELRHDHHESHAD